MNEIKIKKDLNTAYEAFNQEKRNRKHQILLSNGRRVFMTFDFCQKSYTKIYTSGTLGPHSFRFLRT